RRFVDKLDLVRHALFLLLEEFCDALESSRLDFVAYRPFVLRFEGYGGIDNRDGVAEPAAETLYFADDFDVLVPMDARSDGPHDFALVEGVDVIVDDDRQF